MRKLKQTDRLPLTEKRVIPELSIGEQMRQAEASTTSEQMGADLTWMAHERTLMASIRTSTSMIGVGFAVYKFFEDVRRIQMPL
jgi:uncharacterized membrane protein YidH (DUF202 family)